MSAIIDLSASRTQHAKATAERLANLNGKSKTEGIPAPKIGIVIPSGDHVDANFAMALAASQFMMGRLGFMFHLFNQKGSIIAVNRNNGVEQCEKFQCDWCLQIDTDLTFPPNAIPRLLHHAITQRLDIVGASYPRRVHPHQNNAIPLGNEKTVLEGGLAEVMMLPTGFLLVHMSVFGMLKKPYFRFGFVEEDAHPEPVFDGFIPDDGKPRIIGEDFYFCAMARAAGFRVMMDVDLSSELVHWGEAGYRLRGTAEGADVDGNAWERIECATAPPA